MRIGCICRKFRDKNGLFVKGECNEKKHKVKGAFKELHVLASDVDNFTCRHEHTALLGEQKSRGNGHDIYGGLFYCGCVCLQF